MDDYLDCIPVILSITDVTSTTIEVTMLNLFDVAGFQIDIASDSCDIELTDNGFGGTSEEAGFTITSNGVTALGFSLQGNLIPPTDTEEILVTLGANISGCSEGQFNIAEAVVSAPGGVELTTETGEAYYYMEESEEDGGDDGGGDDNYYNVSINETGDSHLVVFLDSIEGLEPGDEVGVFDLNGVIETAEAGEEAQYGEVLVGAGIWEGSQMSISAIMSLDLSDFFFSGLLALLAKTEPSEINTSPANSGLIIEPLTIILDEALISVNAVLTRVFSMESTNGSISLN